MPSERIQRQKHHDPPGDIRRLRPLAVLILAAAVIACSRGGDEAERDLRGQAAASPTATAAALTTPTATPSPSPTPSPTPSPSPSPTPTAEERSPYPLAFSIEQSFRGTSSPGGPHHPPDLSMAVSSNVIVTATNHGAELRDKTGLLLAQEDTREFFSSVVGAREGLADPRVVYDPWSERFFVHYHGGINRPCQVGECVFHNFLAVSKNSNPASLSPSDWHFYAFDATLDGSTPTDHQVDYVRLGVNEQLVVLVGGHPKAVAPGAESGSAFTKIRIFDKQALLSGAAEEWTDISRFADPLTGIVDHVLMQPAIHYDESDVFFLVSVNPGTSCSLVVWGLDDSLGVMQLTHKIVAPDIPPPGQDVPPPGQCARPPDAEQPDGVPPLFLTVSFAAPAIYRDGSLWMTHHMAMDFGSGVVSAVRVVELDVSAWPETPIIKQDIILGEDGVWSFFPALAVNAEGSLALVFARSSLEEYPTTYFSGRLASDPLNTLRPAVLLHAGAASNTVTGGCCGGSRWGDYLSAALDPVDGSVWIIGEHMDTEVLWGSWIGRIAWNSRVDSP